MSSCLKKDVVGRLLVAHVCWLKDRGDLWVGIGKPTIRRRIWGVRETLSADTDQEMLSPGFIETDAHVRALQFAKFSHCCF